MAKSIALVGVEGSAAESIGIELARRLNRQFVNVSAAMRQASLMAVSEMISWQGERAFREFESTVVRALTCRENSVLSVDAGTLANASAREALSDRCLLVLLTADPATALQRGAGTGMPGQDGLEIDHLAVRRLELATASAKMHVGDCALCLDTSGPESQAVNTLMSQLAQAPAASSGA
jgi:shikimate kinase